MRHISSVIVLAAIAGAFPLAASAHPKLVASSPAAGAALDSSPKELRLSFNEELIAKFSGAEVKDQQGKKVEVGAAATDGANKKQLVIAVPAPLAGGAYEVEWHAVAADTHRVHGSYSFTVKR